jgi:hypothetical protein
MDQNAAQNPAGAALPSWMPGLIYLGAFGVGAWLITTGRTTPLEASGYVTPFLAAYERLVSQRGR